MKYNELLKTLSGDANRYRGGYFLRIYINHYLE